MKNNNATVGRGKDKETRSGSCQRRIRIVGGAVPMGPLGTSATEWPIVPAPGDYDDGEFWWN
jgi:hypothetical protein